MLPNGARTTPPCTMTGASSFKVPAADSGKPLSPLLRISSSVPALISPAIPRRGIDLSCRERQLAIRGQIGRCDPPVQIDAGDEGAEAQIAGHQSRFGEAGECRAGHVEQVRRHGAVVPLPAAPAKPLPDRIWM